MKRTQKRRFIKVVKGNKKKVTDVTEGKWITDFKNEESLVSNTAGRLTKWRLKTDICI